MNREHIRGFFGIKPIPYHSAFHDWMAGRTAMGWLLITAWHLFLVGLGFAIGKAPAP